jgi:hypothetical protein
MLVSAAGSLDAMGFFHSKLGVFPQRRRRLPLPFSRRRICGIH